MRRLKILLAFPLAGSHTSRTHSISGTGLTFPELNDDCTDTAAAGPVVVTTTTVSFPNIGRILGPTKRRLQLLYNSGKAAKEPKTWNMTAQIYHALTSQPPEYPSHIKKWVELDNS